MRVTLYSLLVLPILLKCTLGEKASVSFLRRLDKKVCRNEPTCQLLSSAELPASRYTLETRKCMCDAACAEYKDCCADAPAYKEEEQTTESAYHCSTSTGIPIYMKVACPPMYADELTSSRCSKSLQPLTSNETELITPVTSQTTNVTYGNRYCASCHAEGTFVSWTLKPTCGPLLGVRETGDQKELLIDFSSKYLRYSNEIWQRTVYDTNLHQFTVMYDEKLMVCRVSPLMPDELREHVRICVPNVIATCPAESDPEVVKRCRSVFNVVSLAKEYNHKFRNVHCALCNGIPADNVTPCPIIPRGLG